MSIGSRSQVQSPAVLRKSNGSENVGFGNGAVSDRLSNLIVTDYTVLRELDSSKLSAGEYIYVAGQKDPIEIKSGSTTDDGGTLFEFDDGGSGLYGERAYDGFVLVEWFTTHDGSADDTAGINAAAALNKPLLFGPYNFVYTGTLTHAYDIYGVGGATILHQPTADQTDCVVCNGDDAEIVGLTVKNLTDGAGAFNTGDAFSMTGDRINIHHCRVESVFNSTRVESSIGPNGGGGEPLMMVYNGFNFENSEGGIGSDLHVNTGVYVAYRFHQSTDCKYSNINAKATYRGVMYSGNDVDTFTADCHVVGKSVFNDVREIGFKVEQGCDDCTMVGSIWKECCTIGAGTGGAEGRLGIIQGQNFEYDNNIINCSTVYNSLDDGGLVRAGGGSSSDEYGNGFKARRNTVINAKSLSGNVFPVFSVNGVTDFNIDENDIRNAYRAVSVSFGNDGSICGNKVKNMSNHAIILARLVGSVVDRNNIQGAANDGIRCDNVSVGLSRNNSFNNNNIKGANRGMYLVRTKNCTANNNTIQDSATDGMYQNGNDRLTSTGNGFDSSDIGGNTNSTVANNTTITPTLTDEAGTATGGTTADGTVETDCSNGTLYYYVSTNSSETAATIRASGSSQAVSATGEQSVSVTGLTSSTTYYMHFVHDDDDSQESNVVASSSFTTS